MGCYGIRINLVKLHKVDYKLEVCVVLMQGSLTYTQSTAYLHIEIFKK